MSRAQQANDRAADFIERREMAGWSEADQAELDAWLAQSFGNRAAYWRLEQSWREADRIGALGPAPVWNDEADIAPPEPSVYRQPRRFAVAAALALMASVGGGIYLLQPHAPSTLIATTPPPRPQQFATAVGGKRVVPLQDGSKVELNTASIVRAAITPDRREVWLDQGEAYFEVAHRADRPFVVHAGARTITVLGTKFSVRRDGDKVTVSVVEGRVRISDDTRATASQAIVSAGDMAVAQGQSTLLTQTSEDRVEDALSWRSGMLVFDQSPLPSVAAEFNRYNRKHLVVRGGDAARRRIGGAFPANDPQGFARLLSGAYGLRVEENAEMIIISD